MTKSQIEASLRLFKSFVDDGLFKVYGQDYLLTKGIMFDKDIKIVRCMPNTPVSVGEGKTGKLTYCSKCYVYNIKNKMWSKLPDLNLKKARKAIICIGNMIYA